MATRVVGDDVDVDVDTYGSIYDEERLVPSGITVDPPSSSPPSWKTKKLMCAGLLGMTAAVASSTLLFYSILDVSNQASTEPSFLFHDSGPYSKCLPASGPWPTNNQIGGGVNDDNVQDDDDNTTDHSYVTCFSFQGGKDQCWSKSYKEWAGHWQACRPKGYGSVWELGTPTNDRTDNAVLTAGEGVYKTRTCGTPCTTFA